MNRIRTVTTWTMTSVSTLALSLGAVIFIHAAHPSASPTAAAASVTAPVTAPASTVSPTTATTSFGDDGSSFQGGDN